MQVTTLGRTGLKVGVAGLGAGGNSRVGMRQKLSRAESVALIRYGFDLGINFIDTARNYGTEEIVGDAIAEVSRDSLVVSTKANIRESGALIDAKRLAANIDESLQRLQTDYVDVFHLHAVRPADYAYAVEEMLPELLRQKEKGKIRWLGITESAPVDHHHEALRLAVDDGHWDVIMIAFSMLHQNARELIFPTTREKNIGTLMMFVVRNIFSKPALMAKSMQELAAAGKVSADLAGSGDPMGFLIHEAGATSLVEAAYRYARHEPGVDVVLFGTGSREHMKANVQSINRPPLPESDRQKIRDLFGALVGIGLDHPDGAK